MGEAVRSSPAFLPGRLYIRGEQHLYCIGAQQAGSPESAVAGGAEAKTGTPRYEQYLQQWPRFRGPTGSGVAAVQDIPQHWDTESGAGILWKQALPLPGPNSPVVWGDRVFLSGATAEQQALFCLHGDTGELLWQLDVPVEVGDEEYEVAEYTGHAAPSVATDGLRVYGIFATGNLVAADFQGRQVWRKNLGPPHNHYGHASSLCTHEQLVIVQYDQGSAKDELSKLMALDGATGEVAWEVTRPVPASWSSPIVIRHAGRSMVISCTDPWVLAHDAGTGEELWRAGCLSGEVGPSPVFADGVVYVANESCGMFAIRVDGSGDVTESHVEWFTDIDVPDVCSPLVLDDQILLLSHALLGSFALGKSDDVQEPREPVWEEDLVDEVSSSPGRVGDLVYLFAETGKVWILKPTAERCERVAEFEMGEAVRSSPAFLPGRLYIRGEQHLYCIGK
jgi:outer membrane protein assembly factor BamB